METEWTRKAIECEKYIEKRKTFSSHDLFSVFKSLDAEWEKSWYIIMSTIDFLFTFSFIRMQVRV
jgi:hypothetical protein